MKLTTTGNIAIAAGVLIAILTIHISTILAIGLILGGAGARALGKDNTMLTGRRSKSLY